MALINCHECQQQVSDTASTCPHCGAKVVKPKPEKPRTRIKALLIALGVVVILISAFNRPGPESPEAKAAREKAQTEKELRTLAAAAAIASIRAALRNPDSLKIDSLRTDTTGKLICVEYSAQNGFGGFNREYIAFVSGKSQTSPEVWNKHCTKGLFDLTPR